MTPGSAALLGALVIEVAVFWASLNEGARIKTVRAAWAWARTKLSLDKKQVPKEARARTMVWGLILSFGFAGWYLGYVRAVLAATEDATLLPDTDLRPILWASTRDELRFAFGSFSGAVAAANALALYLANRLKITKHPWWAATSGIAPIFISWSLIAASRRMFSDSYLVEAASGLTLIALGCAVWSIWALLDPNE